ncbi:MAG: ASKHA domain-containing protein [Chloroflexi bacterium]|nr:ASKHA domain-containing protein [Chloroflexota bacterium]MDA1282002.1 ASKHA domain-containing protein [Chloroflexota bacterium]
MSPVFLNSKELYAKKDDSLFDFADALSVRVPTSCGRTGECHECIVEVRKGADALSPPTEEEKFLRGNYRLACQACVVDTEVDIEFSVLRRQPRILTAGTKRETKLQPAYVRVDDDVVYNSPDGPTAVDKYRGAIYGIAADLGTTTVVLNFVNLESGETVYTASFENPQRFGGSDVMNRISYDGGADSGELRAVMVSSINFEIGEMVRALKIRRRQIFEFVAVGNTTMRDLFFGLDVQSIGTRPYKSIIEDEFRDAKRTTTALTTTAAELELRIHPKATVYGGPLIASHLGADTAADLLALGIEDQIEPVILVDVGTNTEVVIGNRDRLLAASCPAGPAFEGGEVTYGMPGYDGAVEKVVIDDRGVADLSVIGDVDPIGICGSGLIDLIAELRRTNMMDELGRFTDGSGEYEFSTTNNLTLSRADISALAQAKAANYCGQAIVLREYGLPIEKFEKLYLAGGFANYVDESNAIDIGFIANMPLDKVEKVGNASLEGAVIMLLSTVKREEIEKLTSTVEHVELETAPDFFEFFVEGCMFKPMESI